jgi:membrane associated rhomboid family serine protease
MVRLGAAAALMALTIIVSLICFQSPRRADALSLRPDRVLRQREYYRLISCGFVHADVGHLLLNMLSFYFFAFTLERILGSPAFLALYFTALIVSSLGSAIKHRGDPGYSAVGASGAILGVLFASIVYFPEQKLLLLPIPIPIPAPLFGVLYLGYTWWQSRQSADRINHDAHFTGALFGLAFVGLTDPRAFRRFVEVAANMFS